MLKSVFSTTLLLVVSLALGNSSCGGPSGATSGAGGGNPVSGAAGGAGNLGGAGQGLGGAPTSDAGTPVEVEDPAAHAAAVAALRAELASEQPGDAADFAARWSTRYLATLPYDPLAAQGMDRLTASTLGVSDAEQQALSRDGFVISARQVFPTFFYGYKSIYADHLPLFVSVDSVIHAVHRSYDSALADIEYALLSRQPAESPGGDAGRPGGGHGQ